MWAKRNNSGALARTRAIIRKTGFTETWYSIRVVSFFSAEHPVPNILTPDK
jgi:hypothetical protein